MKKETNSERGAEVEYRKNSPNSPNSLCKSPDCGPLIGQQDGRGDKSTLRLATGGLACLASLASFCGNKLFFCSR